jgi:hypothetical protein
MWASLIALSYSEYIDFCLRVLKLVVGYNSLSFRYAEFKLLGIVFLTGTSFLCDHREEN